MAKIYKITNVINGKSYVGKTEGNIKKRFTNHVNESKDIKKKNRPLYNAFNKYGIENFKLELIEETDNPSEREIYYIAKYDTYYNGYNATLGGEGNRRLDYDAIIQCYEQKQDLNIVAKLMSCNPNTVRLILQNNNIDIINKNSLDSDAIIDCYKKERNLRKTARMMQCSVNGVRGVLERNNIEIYNNLVNYDEVIALYEKEKNTAKVARIMECDSSTIQKILKNNNIEIIKPKQGKKVKQYSLKDQYLETYETTQEAAEKLSENSSPKLARNISRCAKGERKTAYGFKWRYDQA